MPFIYPSYPLTPNYGHPILKNIQGLWQFGGQGDAPKEILNGIKGTGTVSTRGNGGLGSARLYNGSTQYDSYGNNFNQTTNPFTLFLLASADSVAGYKIVAMKGAQTSPDYLEPRYEIGIDDTSKWYFALKDGAAGIELDGPTSVVGEAAALVAVRGGGAMSLFCNGVKFTVSETLGSISNASDLEFGRAVTDGGGGNYFSGKLYSAAIWNRALSDAEAVQLSLNPGLLFRPTNRLYFIGPTTYTKISSLAVTLQKAMSATAGASLAAQTSFTKAASIGTAIQKEFQITAGLIAALQKENSAAADVNLGLLKLSATKITQLIAALQKDFSVASSTDLVLQKLLNATTALSIQINAGPTVMSDVNIALQKTFTKTISLIAALQKEFSLSAGVSLAREKQLISLTTLINLAVQGALSKSVGVNVALQAALTKFSSASIAVQKQFAATAAINLTLQKAVTLQSTINAFLLLRGILIANLDLAIEKHKEFQISLSTALQRVGILTLLLDTYVHPARGAWDAQASDTTVWTPEVGISDVWTPETSLH